MKFKSQNEIMKIITRKVLLAVNLADIKEGLQAVNLVDIEGKRLIYRYYTRHGWWGSNEYEDCDDNWVPC